MQITRFARRRLADARQPAVRGASTEREVPRVRSSERQAAPAPARPRPDHLAKARVARLASGDRLVGTGGTLRNLAKIDRQTRQYPIGGLHGYELSVDRLGEVVERLARTREKRRDEIPGLSAERADSIVGGAVAIQTLAEFVRARHILVSGQGVREGIALGLLKIAVGIARDGERGVAGVARLAVRRLEAGGGVAPAERRRRPAARARAARSGERGDGDRSRRSCSRHRPEPRRGEPARARRPTSCSAPSSTASRTTSWRSCRPSCGGPATVMPTCCRWRRPRHDSTAGWWIAPRSFWRWPTRSRPGARAAGPIAVDCEIGRHVTLSVPIAAILARQGSRQAIRARLRPIAHRQA